MHSEVFELIKNYCEESNLPLSRFLSIAGAQYIKRELQQLSTSNKD